MRKLPKISGTLAVAIFAVVVSVGAIISDNLHFDMALEEDRIRSEKTDKQFERAMELAQTALDQEGEHYQELSEQFEEVVGPHIKFDEHYDLLSLLYSRLVLYRDWVITLQGECREVAEDYYVKANTSFQNAEKQLRAGNFTECKQLVEDAYDSLLEGSARYRECKEAGE